MSGALEATCAACGCALHHDARYVLMLVDEREDPVAEVTVCSVRCLRSASPQLPSLGAVSSSAPRPPINYAELADEIMRRRHEPRVPA